MFFGMGQLGYISTINGGMPHNPHPFSAFVLRPTQDEGFSFSAVCSAFSTSFASIFAPLAFAISTASVAIRCPVRF